MSSASAMIDQGVLQVFLQEHENFPLECKTYSPEAMGLRSLELEPESNLVPENHRLKSTLIRVTPETPTEWILAGKTYDLAYRDFVFAHHISESELESRMNRTINEFGVHDDERLKDFLKCYEGDSTDGYKLFWPLVEATSGKISYQLDFLMFTGEIYVVRENARDSRIVVETLDSPEVNDETQENQAIEANAEETNKTTGAYEWVKGFRLEEMTESEPVLVVEKTECAPERNFFVVTTGHLVGNSDNASNQPRDVVRTRMYAVSHYFGASGDPTSRSAVENSIDPTHYWCVPKREFCYKAVDFGAFDVKVRKGRTESIPVDRIYNLRLGIVSALQLLAVEHCEINKVDG